MHLILRSWPNNRNRYKSTFNTFSSSFYNFVRQNLPTSLIVNKIMCKIMCINKIMCVKLSFEANTPFASCWKTSWRRYNPVFSKSLLNLNIVFTAWKMLFHITVIFLPEHNIFFISSVFYSIFSSVVEVFKLDEKRFPSLASMRASNQNF